MSTKIKHLTTSIICLILFPCFVNAVSLSGTITYDNTANTPMTYVGVWLMQGTTPIYKTSTNSQGYYEFSSVISGSYDIKVFCFKPWGGVNSTDPSLIQQHIVHIITLTGLKLIAADVNSSGSVNSVDALLVQKRYVGLVNSFVPGDWYFEPFNITINNSSITQNIKAICFGDVNGSYIPPTTWACNDAIVDSYDDKSYLTVKIASQCWMRENINKGELLDFSSAQANDSIIQKYAPVEGPLPPFSEYEQACTEFGGLYRWGEMVQYINGADNYNSWNPAPTGNIQGICPSGWHIPWYSEYMTLVDSIGGYSGAAQKMREAGSVHWDTSESNGINTSGFTGLATAVYPDFVGMQQGFFWTASQTNLYNPATNAKMVELVYSSNNLTLEDPQKWRPMSVRCVKD